MTEAPPERPEPGGHIYEKGIIWGPVEYSRLPASSGSAHSRHALGPRKEGDDIRVRDDPTREFLDEADCAMKPAWTLGYVPPLHLRLPGFSYGPEARCSYDLVMMAGIGREEKGRPVRGDTRPIPASYFGLTPAPAEDAPMEVADVGLDELDVESSSPSEATSLASSDSEPELLQCLVPACSPPALDLRQTPEPWMNSYSYEWLAVA